MRKKERGRTARRNGKRIVAFSVLAVLLTGTLACSSLAWAVGSDGSGARLENTVTSDASIEGTSKTGAFSDESAEPFAEVQDVTYLDENGDAQSHAALPLAASDTTWGVNDDQEHWYVIDGNVEFTDRVTVTGDVRLILANGVSPTAHQGITVEGGNKLTIYAQSTVDGTMGRLRALGDGDYAAIGDGRNGTCGTVTINGGHIYATARVNAGIGGGYRSNGGTVEINGGIVEAVGGYGAGIGGGSRGDGGRITINGGVVNATGHQGAGIGGGMDYAGGTITITGGTVNAVGEWGAGVGGGEYGAGGNITISGGTVQAESLSYGAGIGGGTNGQGGTITINSGIVEAVGGDGAGIGGGLWGDGGIITINGGIVDATGKNGAGIGGGYQGDGGVVTVSGGTVRATGTSGSEGIGNGHGGAAGTFTTGADGEALIIASSIADKGRQADWRGIIFEGNDGRVYGNQTLTDRLSLSADHTLEIPENTTLTIGDGVSFANDYNRLTGNGTIAPASYKQTADIEIADQRQVYDGSAFTPTYTYAGNGAVTVKWYAGNNGVKGAELPFSPTIPGSYFVGVSAAETGIWKAAPEQVAKFTIEVNPDLVGDIKDVTDVANNALAAKLTNTDMDLAQRTLPTDVLGQVSIGKDVDIWLTSVRGVSDADAAVIAANLNGWTLVDEIDLALFYRLDGVETQVHETVEPVTVQLTLPDSAVSADASKARSYEVMRVHDGKASVIPATYDAGAKTLTFETDAFSAYAIAYKDAADDASPDAGEQDASGNKTSAGKLTATGDAVSSLGALLACASAMIAGVLVVDRLRASSSQNGRHAAR